MVEYLFRALFVPDIGRDFRGDTYTHSRIEVAGQRGAQVLENECRDILGDKERFDREAFTRFVSRMIRLLGGGKWVINPSCNYYFEYSNFLKSGDAVCAIRLARIVLARVDVATVAMVPLWRTRPLEEQEHAWESLAEPVLLREAVGWGQVPEVFEPLIAEKSPYPHRLLEVRFPPKFAQPVVKSWAFGDRMGLLSDDDIRTRVDLDIHHISVKALVRFCEGVFDAYCSKRDQTK